MISSITFLWAGIVILTTTVIILFILFTKLKKKLREFTKGKDGASLESTLSWLTKKNADIDETLHDHQKKLSVLNQRLKTSVRGIHLVHYDAYGDNSGKQSFSLGILDENKNGAIVSIITNRNHVGMYAREITNGVSQQELTDDEKRVLEEAVKKVHI